MTPRPGQPGDEGRDDGAQEHDVPRTGVLFFSTPGCAACNGARAAISRLGVGTPVPIVEVDARRRASVAARHRVLAAPTLLALHEGAEVARHTGAVSVDVLDRLTAAAAGGTGSRMRSAPRGLTALRLLVAVVLAVAGGITATPTLVLIGAAIAIWALLALAHSAYDLRTH